MTDAVYAILGNRIKALLTGSKYAVKVTVSFAFKFAPNTVAAVVPTLTKVIDCLPAAMVPAVVASMRETVAIPVVGDDEAAVLVAEAYGILLPSPHATSSARVYPVNGLNAACFAA